MTYDDMAADVARFLKEIVPRELGEAGIKVHLLGHSMGGKTAMKIALSPESAGMLESLIVEDIAPKKYDDFDHHQFIDYLKAMKKANLAQTRHQISQELAAVIPNSSVREFLITNLAGGNKAWKWKPNLGTIERYLLDVFDQDDSEGCFPCKTLFISGGNSIYVSEKDHGRILKLFPKAQFCVIPGSGHWVHAEKPYDFMDQVAKFITDA